MTQPKLTIGMPAYNSATHIGQAIESLLTQTYDDFLLLISDNASTDATADICRDYAKQDSRIRYTRKQTNTGMAENFNTVARACESPFFKWATADDYWHTEMLSKTLAGIESSDDIVLCYPKTTVVNDVTKTETQYDDNLELMMDSPAERFRALFERLGLCNAQLGIIRTSVLKQTKMFRNFPGSDMKLLSELSLYGKFKEVPDYLFWRRFHEQASSWDRSSVGASTTAFSCGRIKRHGFRKVARTPGGFFVSVQISSVNRGENESHWFSFA